MADAIHFLSTLPLDGGQIKSLKALSDRLDIQVVDVSQNESVSDEQWQQAEILYTFQALPEAGQAPNLRWIQFYLAGVDSQLEHELLQRSGMRATTLSGGNAPQVAEHALALMLALGHNLPAMFADQAGNQWPTRRLDRYQPSELNGSTVGLIGYGSIGRQIARLLHSFGCTVLAAKRDLKHLDDTGYQREGLGDPDASLVHRLYPHKVLGSMLKDCDFVVVCLPLTDETRGMVGEKEFEAMKADAFLVDVSRGGVVDHTSLIQALSDGQLAGAGLDVFPEEPLPADSPLWEMPNVIISPHVAGLSPHYGERAFELLKENLARYLDDRELLNQVNLERGY